MELMIIDDKDENGKPIYWVCDGRDRTERFNNRGEAERYKKELELRDDDPPSAGSLL